MNKRHLWIMIICCTLPVIGFAVAFYLGVPLGTLGIVALLLLCPLGHILMMRGMGKNHNSDHDHTHNVDKTGKA